MSSSPADVSITHVKFLYCLVFVVSVCQLCSFLYLNHCLARLQVKDIHITRSKRETADLFGGNAVNSFGEDWRISRVNSSRRAVKNFTKIISKDDDGMITIGHSTRIPIVAVEGFCKAAKDYCPAGPPGSPGPQGPMGPRGDPGHRGEKGERGGNGEVGPRGYTGDKGPQGPPGLRGPPGSPGAPGLDGRDGIPGEPGLDGMPGRNGLDGTAGTNGLPGRNGTDGIPGAHGLNGTKGEIGLTGPMGPPGPRGIAGPRGRPGKPGLNGNHGLPGVRAWEVTVNGSKSSELLIPPTIVGSHKFFSGGPIGVKERDNVRLLCAATGHPAPVVQWRRLDTSSIELGSWIDSSLVGHLLNITRIRRDQMGTYMCVAENGVPPPANQTFVLQVKFEPMITIGNRHIRAAVGQNISIQCLVEAFPEAVKYWKKDNMQLLESDSKYSMAVYEDPTSSYKSTMQLFINHIEPSDFANYQCVAKNEIGKTTGKFQLEELDKNLARPPTFDVETTSGINFGPGPPDRVELNDLCPPPPICQTSCPDTQKYSQSCKSGLYSVYELLGYKDLDVRPLRSLTVYPGLQNRDLNCLVYAVGKPVYHHFVNSTYGSWMRDPGPTQIEFGYDTIWTTNETDPKHLLEFSNKTTFRQSILSRKYELMYEFMGNAHVVFNGSFFYNKKDEPVVVRYELISRLSTEKILPFATIDNNTALYSEKHNYMDFSVDDNGLWVIYGLANSNNTIVLKMNAKDLEIQYAWNISVSHRKAGEMFIVCGVLYVVQSNTETITNIRFALDLFTNKRVEVDIPFTNPFKRTTMIGYNHKNKELYTWDKGNQLTYPIRYHDQGLANQTNDEEKGNADSAYYNRTGFEIDEAT